MIYKFIELGKDSLRAIEFTETLEGVLITAVEDETCPLQESVHIELNKNQLFELIGGLLRIQSKLK